MKIRTRAAALIIDDNKILLALHKKDAKEYYLLPGGGIKELESEKEALKRELIEETGLLVEPIKFLFQTDTINPAKTRHIRQRIYLCTFTGSIQPSQDSRVIKAEFVEKENFKNLIFYPNLKSEILECWDKNFEIEPSSYTIKWEE